MSAAVARQVLKCALTPTKKTRARDRTQRETTQHASRPYSSTVTYVLLLCTAASMM